MQSIGHWEGATMMGLFGLPGYWEVIIIVLAILLLFGGKKLPELARGLARGLRIFRDELKGIKHDLDTGEEEAGPETPTDEQQGEEKQ